MYIKRETNIIITDKEREILEKAREILITFEEESSVADDHALQDMYDEFTEYNDRRMALPTAIDLLTTILGDLTHGI